MVKHAPKIDPRTAQDIADQVQKLLEEYAGVEQNQQNKEETQAPQGTKTALVNIFARFAEIIIERLNQVPDKNFLAFLDLLGASRLPPQSARVPLTFFLAAGTTVDAVVPKGTQVAAPPGEGEKDPVIFEMERELVVSAAQLDSVFVRDPEQDMYSDRSLIITNPASLGVPIFRGNQPIEHIFYIGHSELLGFPEIETLKLKINLSKALGIPSNKKVLIFALSLLIQSRLHQLASILVQDYQGEITWQIWQETENEADWKKIIPTNDETQGFTQSGDREIEFSNLTAVPVTTVNSLTNRWLRCRLVTPITLADESRTGMVSADKLPTIEEIKLEATISSSDLLIETAFTNQLPVDLTKDFFPFGEKPKFGDTLYLANSQAFSQQDALITIDIILTNWASGVPPTFIEGNPKLKWEFWNGKQWMAIGTSTLEDDFPADNNIFEDTTRAFTGYFEKVFLFSDQEYTDLTVEAISSDGTAFQLNKDTQDILYLGATERFKDINFSLATKGEGYILIFEYFNGAQWIQLTAIEHNLEDNTSNWTADGHVEFTIPHDWQQTTINEATRYWIRIKTSTQPDIIAQAFQTIFFQADRAHVRFKFPEPPVATIVNGVENFWIRVRIIAGNYGTEARYEKIEPPPDPPASEYRFIEATFAPPSISSITVEYQLTTSEEAPEALLTYNDIVYSKNLIQSIGNQNQLNQKPLSPFKETKAKNPTLYLGFTLPSDREKFTNRNISIFNNITNLKYGEKLIPISPTQRQNVGEVGSTVVHKFLLTNNRSESVQFTLTVLGMSWEAKVSELLLDVQADSFKEVEVKVEIPTEAKLESSDRGFLRVSPANDSSIIYTATFKTFVGTELPKNEEIQLLWEYWNGKKWTKLTVRDDTDKLIRPGLIEFLPPGDFSPRADFNLPPRYWLRVQWLKGNYEVEPRLQQVLLNTTMAVQTITINNEILGSSDGNKNQKFQTTRKPILAGQQLEVRESEIPSALEKQTIEKEEDQDAITSITDTTGRPQEIWVRWHQVKDFYQSGASDRHYVLDHLTGQITFGDGHRGLIPPRGRGNIRMNRYQTGGGVAGNKPAKSIVQLKTTVPYVDRVINYEAAAGGAEAETRDSLIERAPHEIRHRKRAVTREDYEDLAKLASPEVIRAKCLPLANLKVNPLDTKSKLPGVVSVIIVPRSTEAKPLPSLELIRRVQEYLENYAEPTVQISVVGPLYVRVDITAEITLTSLEGASDIAQAVEEKLASFLHPLKGGFEKAGWDFGRQPYKSDFYRLLEGISGVDHVRSLKVNNDIEEPKGAKQTDRFLVYSGNHDISLTFVES